MAPGQAAAMTLQNFVLFLILGALAGWISGLIAKGRGFGLAGNVIVGIVGAFLGGFGFGLLGISAHSFIGQLIFAVIGALRLAKPDSPWAYRRYASNPVKLERARHRAEGFNRRWRQRKHYLWDVIGGKPHLHLPHRQGHHDDHGDDSGGSRI